MKEPIVMYRLSVNISAVDAGADFICADETAQAQFLRAMEANANYALWGTQCRDISEQIGIQLDIEHNRTDARPRVLDIARMLETLAWSIRNQKCGFVGD